MNPATQAMILFKAAKDAGAEEDALAIIQTGRSQRDTDTSVDWPMAVLQLEALVQTLPESARESLVATVDGFTGGTGIEVDYVEEAAVA